MFTYVDNVFFDNLFGGKFEEKKHKQLQIPLFWRKKSNTFSFKEFQSTQYFEACVPYENLMRVIFSYSWRIVYE